MKTYLFCSLIALCVMPLPGSVRADEEPVDQEAIISGESSEVSDPGSTDTSSPLISEFSEESSEPGYAEAKVVEIVDQEEHVSLAGAVGIEQTYWTQTVRASIYKGQEAGSEVEFTHTAFQKNWILQKGNKVTIAIDTAWNGTKTYQVTGFVRRYTIYWFSLGFVLIAALVGGIGTLRALLGLLISVMGIFMFLLPAILDGQNPLVMAALFVALVSLIVVPVSIGFSKKSLVAIIGIIGGCLGALLLAAVMGKLMQVSGFEDEDSLFLMSHVGESFDFRGVLFAGVLISSLGAVNDVAISVASAMQEVASSMEKIVPYTLVKSGMNMGRDVIGSMIDTLVLAYIGAALPTTLLFIARDLSFNQILNFDFIAVEIMRALAGSLGLVIAVPVSVIAGSLFLTSKKGNQ